MFAELVCLEMTPAKWHGGGSIFRGLAVRRANQVTFNLVRHLPPLTRAVQMHRLHGVDYSGFDDDPSSPPELVTLRRTAQRSGAFVLVAKDQSPLFLLGHVMFLLNVQPNAARVEHGRAAPALPYMKAIGSIPCGEASEETFSCAHSRYAMRRDLQCG
jgi:hypothetical protein